MRVHCIAMDETVIPLHPPSPLGRRFNMDGEGMSVKWQSRQRLPLYSVGLDDVLWSTRWAAAGGTGGWLRRAAARSERSTAAAASRRALAPGGSSPACSRGMLL